MINDTILSMTLDGETELAKHVRYRGTLSIMRRLEVIEQIIKSDKLANDEKFSAIGYLTEVEE